MNLAEADRMAAQTVHMLQRSSSHDSCEVGEEIAKECVGCRPHDYTSCLSRFIMYREM